MSNINGTNFYPPPTIFTHPRPLSSPSLGSIAFVPLLFLCSRFIVFAFVFGFPFLVPYIFDIVMIPRNHGGRKKKKNDDHNESQNKWPQTSMLTYRIIQDHTCYPRMPCSEYRRYSCWKWTPTRGRPLPYPRNQNIRRYSSLPLSLFLNLSPGPRVSPRLATIHHCNLWHRKSKKMISSGTQKMRMSIGKRIQKYDSLTGCTLSYDNNRSCTPSLPKKGKNIWWW